MRQHRFGNSNDVVRQHEVPAVQCRGGLGRAEQLEHGTRAGTKAQHGAVARGPSHGHGVLLHGLGHVDLLDGGDHRRDVRGGHHGGHPRQRGRGLVGLQHFDLGLLVRVTHGDPCHEPVPLRFGQRVGPFHLDRVLGGHHHERLGQLVGMAVHRHLVLLHAFEQGGLGLGGGAVDFVADDDVGEDGTGPELELARRLVVDGHAGHVRGEQVGGELDPADGAVDRAGQGLGEERLADAGHVFEQQVALGQQHCQGELGGFGLAVDHGVDGGQDAFARGAEGRRRPRRPGLWPLSWLPAVRSTPGEALPAGESLIDRGASVGFHRQPFSPGDAGNGQQSLPSPVGGRSHLSVPATNTTAVPDREFRVILGIRAAARTRHCWTLHGRPRATCGSPLGWRNVQFPDPQRPTGRPAADGSGKQGYPPAPEPLPVPVMDNHTHLDFPGGDAGEVAAAPWTPPRP